MEPLSSWRPRSIPATLSRLSLPEFVDLVASPAAAAEVSVAFGTPTIVVDLDGPASANFCPPRVVGLPSVVVGVHPGQDLASALYNEVGAGARR